MSVMPTQRILDRDDGASVVVVALSLTLLLLFIAVAIDAAGFGYNERRQAQSAADVGALAAVQFASPSFVGDPACASLTGLAKSRCNGAAEAMEVANSTLNDPSLADWTDASRCPNRPAGFTASPLTPCVAFNANNQRAWVQIPILRRPTTIARAVGFDSISVSAAAIAGSSLDFPGSVLPFLLPGNAASADYNCLKAGSVPNFGPCTELPTTGNFGAMDFYLYGNLDLNYTERCTGDENGRFNANIARGVDHPLGLHPTGNGSGRIDRDHCPDFGAMPNMVYAQTGNVSIEQGFLYGGTSYAAEPYPGRIEDPDGFMVRGPQGNTAAAFIDDTPIWDYLRDDLGGTACDSSVVDTPAEMDSCVSWAEGVGRVIFDKAIIDATRFGWTPSVWENDFSGGSSVPYHIKGYQPVYLDTTFYGCSSGLCDIIHTPGVADSGACPTNPAEARITCGTPGGGNKNLVAISAWILSPSLVPDAAKAPAPGDNNQRAFNLID
jgi:Flp pilus assembly protein TadG